MSGGGGCGWDGEGIGSLVCLGLIDCMGYGGGFLRNFYSTRGMFSRSMSRPELS